MVRAMPTCRPVLAAIALAALCPPSVADAADYEEVVQVWTYRQYDGFGMFGVGDVCGRSGYPATVLELVDTYPDEVEPADLGPGFVGFRIPRSGDGFVLRRYSERGEDCAVGVLRIRFADGTVWTTGRLAGGDPIPVEQAYPRYGSGRADRLYGSERYGDALYGLGGADRLYGYAGIDVLDGGDGNDRLYGYAGDDLLHGGTGNDTLFGDDGDDTYLFARGDGDDVISDSAGRVRLLLLDHRREDVAFRRIGDSLVIELADGGRITVDDVYAGRAKIDFVRLRDGFIDGDPLSPPAP